MKVDIIGLMSEVKPKLRKTLRELEDAKEKLTQIDMPHDYYYYSKLRNMPQDISDIEESIKDIQNWLDDKIIKLINAENKNQKLFGESFTKLYPSDTVKILKILKEKRYRC